LESDISKYLVGKDSIIRDVMAQADIGRRGIVLVVDEDRCLVSTVTDGDLRRAVLANIDLDSPVSVLLEKKPRVKPITAPHDSDPATMMNILLENKILHLPLVDDGYRVVSIVRLDEFVDPPPLPLQAVIMAGGRGTRLQPLTDNLPKPMLPVGDQPLMEITVKQLKDAGIRQVDVAVHHMPEKITEHFGDGKAYGVDINYVTEDQPLGTAGALGLMDHPGDTMLVINGDILTQVDYRAMLQFHNENQAELTVAILQYDLQVPYGVIETEGSLVRGLSEKPTFPFFVNGGIYLLEPSAHASIPKEKRSDMTDLIHRLVADGRKVAAFPVREYWLDIGQTSDYQKAQEDFKLKRVTP